MKKSKVFRKSKTAEELISNLITNFTLLGKSFNRKKNEDEINAEKNFYGRLFLRLKRIEDDKFPSAFGVSFQNREYILYFNPNYLFQCNEETFFYFLKHEGMHLINKHLFMLNKIIKFESNENKLKIKREMYNYATDMYCNFNGQLPRIIKLENSDYNLIFPSDFNLPESKDYSSDTYYLKLLEQQRKKDSKENSSSKKNNKGDESKSDNNSNSSNDPSDNSQSNKKSESSKKNKDKKNNKSEKNDPLNSSSNKEKGDLLNNHKHWNVENIEINDMVEANIKLQKNVHEILMDMKNKKLIGNLPGYLQVMCEGFLGLPQLPYYQIIHNLIRATKLSKFRRSSTRLNRKKIYSFVLNEDSTLKKDMIPCILPYPGKVKDYSFKVVILIDTSGSMSISEMKESLKGAKHLLENDKNTLITILEVDTKIHKEYQVKKISDIKPEFHGRGGTRLSPGLKRARELKPDVVLIFTDGMIADRLSNENRKAYPKKMIWIISKNGTDQYIKGYGFHVKIP